MREIKFRGKRIDSELWVEGSLVNNIFFRAGTNRPVPYIINPDEYEEYCCMEDIGELAVEVIEDTVGQFTGLHDKNGVEIYEGDIIKRTIHCSYRNDGMAYDVLFQVPGIQELYGNKIEKDDANNSVDLWETSFEVIGNIHEGEQPCTSAIVE